MPYNQIIISYILTFTLSAYIRDKRKISGNKPFHRQRINEKSLKKYEYYTCNPNKLLM
jgi:hypothetical protein